MMVDEKIRPPREASMIRQFGSFRENAENCADLAESADDEPQYLRYKRMEAAWRALALEQDWLDGKLWPKELKQEGATAHAMS
jgi:hypothetical protein